MRLTLANHPVTEMLFGNGTRLQGSRLRVDSEELRSLILEDPRLRSVDLEIVSPGESCRAGIVFDVVEPRAKESGSGADFPGILAPPLPAGQGTTHVLRGAAVTVLDEAARGVEGRILEMSGPASERTPFSSLHHLVVVPHAVPGIERYAVLNALRVASARASVHLARAALRTAPATTEAFELAGPGEPGREGLPRIGYIAQVHSRQRVAERDEHILYGNNTAGMLPVPLHPNEWLDGALTASYGWSETYFYQNNPVVGDLYRRHQAGELTFAGTIATVAASRDEDRNLNCMMAAHLARWVLQADGLVLTKYGGGAPHSDMALTARLCERMGMRTAVQVSDMSRDRRTESALLFNFPEVDAIVYGGGSDTRWEVPGVERTVGGNSAVALALSAPQVLTAQNVCGVINQQGAQRLQGMVT